MPIIASFMNQEITDTARRRLLFSGNLFVYTPRAATIELGTAAGDVLEKMFGPDPVDAQQRTSEAEFARLFHQAVEEFESVGMELAGHVVADLGCDPATTFIGAVSLSAATGDGFLAHGLGIPQNPHRDTWFAAAACQVNWRVPLFDLDASASLAFHPLYWDTPVRNNSRDFRYERWYESARSACMPSTEDRLLQPRPTGPIDLAAQIRVCCPAGGLIVSSVAQLSSTVPNETSKTHFGVRFQTVSELDLVSGLGALNLDADPDGSMLSNFVRCSDLGPVPRQLIDWERQRRRAGRRRARS